ncbi:MAG: dienelactone hydrolase family protein [Desulforhopalus sp.]
MIDRKVRQVFQDYSDGSIDRRQFLEKLTKLAGSLAAAYALLPILEDDYLARAEVIPADDSRLETGYIMYPGVSGEIRAYQAMPKKTEKFPGVLIVHENKGLNPHIEDVARRIALEGYVALAPDALSTAGGTPQDPKEAVEMIRNLDMETTIKNFAAAAAYLKTSPNTTGRVGVVGFCWGGAMANQLAATSGDIIAAVPYYGRQPASSDVANIKASLLLHYAGLDERINEGISAYEEALKQNGVDYQIFMYEGAKHAFNNDTNPERYNKEAADLAWQRTIAFLNDKLKS